MTCTASTTESAGTQAVQQALTQASTNPGADTVEIGAGTFKTPAANALTYNVAGTQPVTIRGRGATTILTYNGTPSSNAVLLVGSTAAGDAITVEDLNVLIPTGANTLYGVGSIGPNQTTIRNVSVTAADSTPKNSFGFQIDNGDLLTGSSVTLPRGTVAVSSNNYGVSMQGTSLAAGPVVQDSTLSALVGATGNPLATGAMFGTVLRCRIDAAFGAGALFNPGEIDVQDTLIKVEDGTLGIPQVPPSGLLAFPVASGTQTITARHVTIVSSPGSVSHSGLTEFVGAATQAALIDISDSIIAGVDASITRNAANFGTASVSIDHSDFDPAKITNQSVGGLGAIIQGDGNLNVDPQFANAAGGDYSLALGSPLIDVGTPGSLEPGESPTDVLGNPRITDGNADRAAIRDMGAFEHPTVNPPAPPTPDPDPTADTTPPDTKAGKFSKKTRKKTLKLRFSSTEAGSTFTCKLDKGKTKACKSPYTAKKLKPGKHVLVVTAKDPAGNVDPTPAKLRFKVLKKHKRHR